MSHKSILKSPDSIKKFSSVRFFDQVKEFEAKEIKGRRSWVGVRDSDGNNKKMIRISEVRSVSPSVLGREKKEKSEKMKDFKVSVEKLKSEGIRLKRVKVVHEEKLRIGSPLWKERNGMVQKRLTGKS